MANMNSSPGTPSTLERSASGSEQSSPAPDSRNAGPKAERPTVGSSNPAEPDLTDQGDGASNTNDGHIGTQPPNTSGRMILQFKDNEHHVRRYRLRRNETLGRYMHDYAEHNGMGLQGLRFMFDGERLLDGSTPQLLNMENNDIVDVYQEAVGGGGPSLGSGGKGGNALTADDEDAASVSSWTAVSEDDDCAFPEEEEEVSAYQSDTAEMVPSDNHCGLTTSIEPSKREAEGSGGATPSTALQGGTTRPIAIATGRSSKRSRVQTKDKQLDPSLRNPRKPLDEAITRLDKVISSTQCAVQRLDAEISAGHSTRLSSPLWPEHRLAANAFTRPDRASIRGEARLHAFRPGTHARLASLPADSAHRVRVADPSTAVANGRSQAHDRFLILVEGRTPEVREAVDMDRSAQFRALDRTLRSKYAWDGFRLRFRHNGVRLNDCDTPATRGLRPGDIVYMSEERLPWLTNAA